MEFETRMLIQERSNLMRSCLLALFLTVVVPSCIITTDDDDDNNDNPEEVLTSTTGPTHCGTITEDEVWASDLNPHIVTCDVNLEGGNLIIGPGTVVQFDNDTGLLVSEEGGTASLDVRGTADKPVSFHSSNGTSPGLWRGLEIAEAAGTIELRHLTIDSGGGFNNIAALRVDSTDITVDNLTVSNSEEYGLYLWAGAGLTADSTALVVTGTAGWPVRIDPDRADSLPAEGSDYTGNDIDGIEVTTSGTDYDEVVGPRQWEDLGVPYYIMNGLTLEGSIGSSAILTLLEGVTLRFDTQSELSIANYSGAAGLVTQGTADKPVTLTSANAAERGAWPGISAGDNTVDADFQLVNTVIEYGGGFNNTACLRVENAQVYVDNVTIRGCEEYGFHLWESGAFQDGSSGLKVSDSEVAGSIWAYQAHTVPEEGIELTDNDENVLIATYGMSQSITTEVTWGDIGVVYRIDMDLDIGGTSSTPGILNLVPGLRLEFTHAGTLVVGHSGAGGIRAVGTAEAPIVFSGAEAQENGAWGGIEIYGNAIDESSIFEHCVIEYGGGFNAIANVELTDASPTLRSCTISHSEEWGIYQYGSCSPVLEDITFLDNPSGDIGAL